ncbi:MAG: hypothetical protein B7Z37_21340 [Verrucomicrobia bacterium 12-59-8]|nr:MAG: hypothetical protein B7Z37_21340 [Verrucomicrobia bacterium 12-59-8]
MATSLITQPVSFRNVIVIAATLGVAGVPFTNTRAIEACAEKPVKVAATGAEAAVVDAKKIAAKFRDRGYVIQPLANGDSSSPTLCTIAVEPGIDCVLMLGIENAKQAKVGFDLVVKDDIGRTVASDTRLLNRACVAFGSARGGDYTVSVQPVAAGQKSHICWSLLLATRSYLVQANEDAQKVAAKFQARGYEFRTLGKGDNQQLAGSFSLDLPKATDCVIIVGVDQFLPGADLVVHDADGRVVGKDSRTLKRAAVEFSTATAGRFKVTVETSKQAPLGAYVVLAGIQPIGPMNKGGTRSP